MSLCRDGFHMSLVYGRYLLGAVWYETLTGQSVWIMVCALRRLRPREWRWMIRCWRMLTRGAAHKFCTLIEFDNISLATLFDRKREIVF